MIYGMKHNIRTKNISLPQINNKTMTSNMSNPFINIKSELQSEKPIEQYNRNNRKIALTKEVNMELLELSLKRLIDSKKNKQGDLRVKNTEILQEIQDLNSVTSI